MVNNTMDTTEIMLKELTEASRVPRYEAEVWEVIERYLKTHGEITFLIKREIIWLKNRTYLLNLF